MPTASFPNVVGCDLHRAKALILSKLPFNKIVFRVVPSSPGKRNPVVEPGANEIVLMYNPKDDSVWTTPKFYGSIRSKPSQADDADFEDLTSGSESPDYEWQEEQ